ncbi:MAG: 50S ribosomal protein L13 [Parcubacteria group bacterium]|nr:50S ribosomal protein L13 [Parcubacteria group bacterium]
MTEVKIDATNQVLGRLATQIAILLRDKNKPSFEYNILPQTKVIVVNTDKLKFTGKKLKNKIYYRYTGYPGGIKAESLEKVVKKDSRKLVKQTVLAMLPKNRLRSKIIKNLEIYKNDSKKTNN